MKLLSVFKHQGMARSEILNKEVLVPFWKMNLSDEEVNLIKHTICAAAGVGRLSSYPIESALLFAEWWRNMYDGAAPSKERVAQYAGIGRDYAEDLFKSAKNALKICGIKVTRIESDEGRSSNRFFSTLLLQGGLPMKSMLDQRIFGSYSRFLISLADNLANMIPDWENPSIVESLGCDSYLPRTFRNNTIYQLGLDIVHAVIEDKQFLLPFDANLDQLKQLISEIHSTYENRVRAQRYHRPLSLGWELAYDEETGAACMEYYLNNVKTIPVEKVFEFGEGLYQFSVKVSGQKVASFRRGRDGFDCLASNIVKIPWKGERSVNVIAVGPDYRSIPLETVDNCPPDFSYPQCFVKGEFKWHYRHSIPDGVECLLLFDPSIWSCRSADAFKVTLLDMQLNGVYIQKTDVSFVNVLTGEETTISNNCNYNISFVHEIIPWIDSSSLHVVTKSPNYIIYDSDWNPVNARYIQYYKKKGSLEWLGINVNRRLPEGLLDFKIIFPDDSYREYTVYCVSGFSPVVSFCSEGEVELNVHCDWGTVSPMNIEGVNVSRQGDVITITRNANDIGFPLTLPFRLIGNEKRGELIFQYPTPFTMFCLYDRINNKVVESGEEIAFGNLSEYMIIQHNQNVPTISFSSMDNTRRVRLSLTNSLTSLSDFSEIIDGFFILSGVADNQFVTLKFGNTRINIRRFLQHLIVREDKSLELTNGGDITSLLCCFINTTEHGGLSIDSFSEDFIVDVEARDKACLFFSSKADRCRIIPKLIGDQLSIDDWRHTLNEKRVFTDAFAIELAWVECCSAFSIAVEHDLPFGTFNCLNAIATDPFLIARLHIAMWGSNMTDIFLKGILRFEQEAAFCVNWIKKENWENAMADLSIMIDNELLSYNSYESLTEFMYNSLASTSGEVLFPVFASEEKTFSDALFIKPVTLNTIRAEIQGVTDGNDDMPSLKIRLDGNNYYNPRNGMNDYQMTFIRSVLKVYESHTNRCEDIFHESEAVRRVICFYSQRCHNAYNELLEMTINN